MTPVPHTVLDRLAEAHAAATPGPWTERQDFIDQGVPDNTKTLNSRDGSYVGTIVLSHRGEDNAAAIVALHNSAEWLLRLARERYALQAAVLALADEMDRDAARSARAGCDDVAAERAAAAVRIRGTVTAALTGEELPWCNASFCREHENGEHRISSGRCIIVPAEDPAALRRRIHDPGVHKPFTDDGVTYCGHAGDGGIWEGCGHFWPCPTVAAGLTGDPS